VVLPAEGQHLPVEVFRHTDHEPRLHFIRIVVALEDHAFERDAIAAYMAVLAPDIEGKGKMSHAVNQFRSCDVLGKHLKILQGLRILGMDSWAKRAY
jgi:hypothetical protein